MLFKTLYQFNYHLILPFQKRKILKCYSLNCDGNLEMTKLNFFKLTTKKRVNFVGFN